MTEQKLKKKKERRKAFEKHNRVLHQNLKGSNNFKSYTIPPLSLGNKTFSRKTKKGLASMNKKKRKEIATMGGKAQGKAVNPGNFANRPKNERVQAGRKGGSFIKKIFSKNHE